MTYHMWPQVLMAIFLTFPVIVGIKDHGKVSDKPINRASMCAVSLWLALVLGAGGFWDIR